MISKYDLPESITLPTGELLKPVIGGHLNQKPFAPNLDASVILNRNGIAKIAKAKGLKYRMVSVLSRNLRGKIDLHGRPYGPTYWCFVEVKPNEEGAACKQ